MNASSKLKRKTAGFWLACAAILFAIAGLIVFGIYQSQKGVGIGGIYAFIIIGILCQVALFFYDGKLGPVLSIAAAVLYALAFGFSVSGGVGNITDYFTGVVCFGIPGLAPLNFVIAALLLISTILSIAVCFMRREKSE